MKKPIIYTIAAIALAGMMTITSCTKSPDPTPETPLEEYDATRIQFVKLNADGSENKDTITINFDRSGRPDPAVIHLKAHAAYHLYLTLLKNGKSMNAEIIAEGTLHRFFFLPDHPGILDYSYGDQDSEGIGIGLRGTLSVVDTGRLELKVVLRHGLDKSAPAAADWNSKYYEAAGGADDLNISFSLIAE